MSNNAQIVRIKRGKHVFEAATNEGTVLKYRDGKLGWSQVPLVEVVFTSFQKGNKANEKDLHEAFGTSDVNAVLKEIVEKGDLQVSSAERKEAVDKKLKEICKDTTIFLCWIV